MSKYTTEVRYICEQKQDYRKALDSIISIQYLTSLGIKFSQLTGKFSTKAIERFSVKNLEILLYTRNLCRNRWFMAVVA